MAKKLFSIVFVLFLSACAVKNKPDAPPKVETPKSTETTTPTVEVKVEVPPPPQDVEQPITIEENKPIIVKTPPKIAIIFSGGGAKAWAHIGFLKEIEKEKWPIHSIAGFEWGAVVAAVYAKNLSANEVEWELSKVKDFDDLDKISQSIFNNQSVAELKIPFVCSSLNVAQHQNYLLNRGQLNKLMPFCLAHPPLSRPYANSVADLTDVASLAQHLHSTGAGKVILINVLSQVRTRPYDVESLSSENILWVKSATLMSKRIAGVDEVIQIALDEYDIKDIDKKREIIAKGAELSYNQVKKLTEKFGL